MKIGKVISSVIKQIQNKPWAIIKSQISGRDDIQETPQAAPFGIDSRPVKDLRAVYAPTENTGEPVLIGYFMEVAQAEPGELVTFSTNDSGEIQAYIFHKKNGDLELRGSADNVIGYTQTAASVNEIKQDLNSLKTIFNSWAVSPGDGGAALKSALAPYIAAPIAQNIEDGKKDQIKTE